MWLLTELNIPDVSLHLLIGCNISDVFIYLYGKQEERPEF